MGMHTMRRTGGPSTATGRLLFSGVAALALVTGTAGTAFAGEYSESHDKDYDKGHDKDYDKDGDHDEDDDAYEDEIEKIKEKAEEMSLICGTVDDAAAAVDELLGGLVTDLTPEAVAELEAQLLDILCPALADLGL